MANVEALAIVRDAAAVRASHPSVSSLEVLDLAMEGRHGSHPDFQDENAPGGSWMHWTAPFGQLLHIALLGYAITPTIAQLNGRGDPDRTAEFLDEVTTLVRNLFADRYGLWDQPPLVLARRRAWIGACFQYMASHIEEIDSRLAVDDLEYVAQSLFEDPAYGSMDPVEAAQAYVRSCKEPLSPTAGG